MLGISEAEAIKNVMLKETVDGEFTATADIARVALMFSSFQSNALTGQSLVVSHGWFMQLSKGRRSCIFNRSNKLLNFSMILVRTSCRVSERLFSGS
jgi:hypothetical protein